LLLLSGRTADLLGRRRVFMAGVGLFATSSLLCGLAWSPAVLSGVADQESGLAAGLADSAFNTGSALGIAILSTVAVSRARDVPHVAGRDAGLRAMTEGFQAAFAVAAGIAALGVLLSLLLFRPRRLAEGSTARAGAAPETEPLEER
jgi:MFS family permease